MVFFKPKEEKRREVPVERAKELLNKGFSEIEVIEILRKEGYNVDEIDKALEEAVKARVKESQQITQTPIQAQSLASQSQQSPIQTQPASQFQQTSTQVQPLISQFQQQAQTIKQPEKEEEEYVYLSIEEFVEAILRERLKELNVRLMEFSEKQKEIENTIANLNEKIEEFHKSKAYEYEKILNEIRSLKEIIDNLSLKVEATNKTIKELLPSLVESVRLLGEIAQKIKQ